MKLNIPPLGSRDRVVLEVDEGVVGVFGRIGDYSKEISAAEMEAVKDAVPKRQREFFTGRYFARVAQESLGVVPAEIKRSSNSNRRPIWPRGMVGSISHSDSLAMVILSRSEKYSGIGVDMELEGRVTASLLPLVLTERETDLLPSLSDLPSPETLIFSAKESVYKAVNPIVGLMIDFKEVEIQFADRSFGSFDARYIGPNSDNRILDHGRGSFESYEDHLVTTFVM